jgi:hypothetical protein
MSVLLVFLILLGVGYFILRGIRLSYISGFNFYFSADVIEYALPFLLISLQAVLIEFSVLGSPWDALLAASLTIGAGVINLLGRAQRERWEKSSQKTWPDRWREWKAKSNCAGLIRLVDRLARYIGDDGSR